MRVENFMLVVLLLRGTRGDARGVAAGNAKSERGWWRRVRRQPAARSINVRATDADERKSEGKAVAATRTTPRNCVTCAREHAHAGHH